MNEVDVTLLFVLLVMILITASVIDIRSHRIPNWLTYPAVLFGIGFHTLLRGFDGLFLSGTGMLLGFGFLIVFYLVGGMGAGDVKLMAVVGAFLGPKGVFAAFIFTALVGGIYAIVLLIRGGRPGARLAGLGTPFAFYLGGLTSSGSIDETTRAVPKLCYGVAITIGTVLSMGLKGYFY
jgi:prepilin peptidase CpaA